MYKMDNKSSISQLISKERKRLGYNQEEFALRVGVSLSFLRALEQGKPTVRLDKVNEVLSYLGYELVPRQIE